MHRLALKERIRTAQVKAALAVNQEMINLYWQIGCEILNKQNEKGWGAKVVNRLAKDLKREFPDVKGSSRSNLQYMRSFAEAYPDWQIFQKLAGQIPWFHNCVLLDKVKDSTERLWYIQQTIENGWSRNVLVLQIESGLYQRQGGTITNFERTLPQPQSDLAQNLIKDPYNFDFLTISKDAREQELERGLINHIRDFLLEGVFEVGQCKAPPHFNDVRLTRHDNVNWKRSQRCCTDQCPPFVAPG